MAELSPFDLIAPVRTLRRELGLTPNDLAVLAALLSFIPRRINAGKAEVSPTSMTVFPSNHALSERANGLDERTLRRCIARLVTAGLIQRRDSANGKRFPLRYGGVIRDAFGFDMSPLRDAHAELSHRARQADLAAERLRSLKAEALALRAEILRNECTGPEARTILDEARNVLRRATLTAETILRLIAGFRSLVQALPAALTKDAATAVAEDGEQDTLRTELADAEIVADPDHAPTDGMSAKDGQIVRHIESININSNKTRVENKRAHRHPDTETSGQKKYAKNAPALNWADYAHLSSFFPEPPETMQALTCIVLEMGQMLRLTRDRLLDGLRTLGTAGLLACLESLIARYNEIRDPGAYFNQMIAERR